MATINELVARMKVRLSRQQDSSIDTRIIDELIAAQEDLECGSTLPWFLVTQASYAVSGAHETFPLSSYPGFLRICDDDYGLRVEDLTRVDEQSIKLTKQDTYEQLLRYSAGVADAATLPDSYCILGNIAHVRKKQVVSRTYKLSYLKKDTTIPAAGASTLWSTNVPSLLMATAGVEVARYLRDGENVKYFMGLKGQKYAEMIRRNQALQDADQSYVMDE